MDLQTTPMPIQFLIQALKHGSLKPPNPLEEREQQKALQEARIQALMGGQQSSAQSSGRAITQYAGDAPLQRRMRDAGLE